MLVILNIVMSSRISDYEEKLIVSRTDTNKSGFFAKTETGHECPDAVGGPDTPILQAKYFYSRFCPWCMKEEPILKRLVRTYGSLVRIEWYNVDKCPELVEDYSVSGVPTFVFSTTDNKTEYTHYGFIYEKDLVRLVCEVTGGC